MPPRARRISAVIAALAVFVMSIDCACAGGMSSIKQEGSANAGNAARAMPCCAHHEGAARHCKRQSRDAPEHQPKPCSGACEHCGQTVVNDTVAAPSHGASFLLHAFVPILAIEPAGPRASALHVQCSAPASADLPPPITSPTLLSLHCALTN